MESLPVKFVGKTLLYALGYSHINYHRNFRSVFRPDYNHERDKHPLRRKHHNEEGWKPGREGGIQKRDYASYEEYIEHQKQKWNEMLQSKGGLSTKDLLQYRLRFYKRFKILSRYLPKDARILCLGARQGTEVEVIRDLGFTQAWGLDLNPGPGNQLVREGDFMNLTEPDGSVDLIYTNCIDHVYDLDRFFKGCRRVLKPQGYAYFDVACQKGGVFEAIDWDRPEIIVGEAMKHFQELIYCEKEERWMPTLLRGRA